MSRPISEQEYFNLTLSRIPEVKRGEQHSLKKGENLWTIAREKLGNNAKKSELLDYTYKVAKLNGYKTLDEMNSLKINDVIYLPEISKIDSSSKNLKPKTVTSDSGNKKQETVTKTQDTTHGKKLRFMLLQNNDSVPVFTWQNEGSFLLDRFQKQHEIKVPYAPADEPKSVAAKPKQQQKTVIKKNNTVKTETKVKPNSEFPKTNNRAEASFYDAISTIVHNPDNKDIKCTKGYNIAGSDFYYIDIYNPADKSHEKNLIAFRVSKTTGEITSMSFNDTNELNPLKYDYDINNNGQIVQNTDNYASPRKNVGQVDMTFYNKLISILKEKAKERDAMRE